MNTERRSKALPPGKLPRNATRRSDLEKQIATLQGALINLQHQKEEWKDVATELIEHIRYLYQYSDPNTIKVLTQRVNALQEEIDKEYHG